MPPPLESGHGKEDTESRRQKAAALRAGRIQQGEGQEGLIAGMQWAVSLEGVNSKTLSNR